MDPEDLIDELVECGDDEPREWSFWFTVLFFTWLWS